MKELLALISENRRKFLAFLCENDALHSLSLGFVKIYDIGKAKVVMRTEKLKEVCNALAQ